MRNKNKAFLSCAILAGVLLAAGGAMAQTPSGSCTAGAYLVEAYGPTFVACPSPATGDCTEIEYKISGGTPDHAAAVVASGSTNCTTPSIVSVTGSTNLSGNQWFAPGVGDNLTGLGRLACHEEAAKINPSGTLPSFKMVVTGQRSAAPKSVVTKKGGLTRSCEIVGIGELGATPNPFETNLKTETVVFKGCAVKFTYNLSTGAVVTAAPDPTSPKPQCTTNGNEPAGTCCTFLTADVGQLDLTLNTGSGPLILGKGKFGDGYVSTGLNSCTTRVIGGRVYTWGDPCPEE